MYSTLKEVKPGGTQWEKKAKRKYLNWLLFLKGILRQKAAKNAIVSVCTIYLYNSILYMILFEMYRFVFTETSWSGMPTASKFIFSS